MRRVLLAALAVALSACGASGDPDRSEGPHEITLQELADQLALGDTFAEIELDPSTLVAGEVHVHSPDDEEKLVSEVAALDAGRGELRLTLGNLLVTYGDAAEFRGAGGSSMSRAEWEAAIAAGTPVEVRRDTPATPQGPKDPAFEAGDLRITGGADEHRIEMLLDEDNLTLESDDEGTIGVLGLEITIDRRTDLRDDDDLGTDPGTADTEFAGSVASVDVLDGTLTLASGLVVDVKGATFDPEGDLFSLGAVNDALLAGKTVRAEGQGDLATDGTLVATEVKVEVDG